MTNPVMGSPLGGLGSGSSSVVQGVASDMYGVGYSGIGYKTADVRVVPLATSEGASCVDVEPENAYNGTYPLARFLYLYVNKAPNRPIDPLVREFVSYVLSRAGQEIVVKDGYLPIPASISPPEQRTGLLQPPSRPAR